MSIYDAIHEGSGKSKKFTGGMEIRPPKNTYEWWRFIKGEYPHPADESRTLAFQIAHRVWIPGGGPNGKGTSVACNCRDGQLDVPCVPCYCKEHYVEMQEKYPKRKFDTLTPRKIYAHTVLVLGKYHIVDYEGNDEKSRVYEKVRCTETSTCSFCCDKFEDVKKIHSGKKHLYAPGYGHVTKLGIYNREIGETCLQCKGKIIVLNWFCPKCQRVLFDTEMLQRDLEKAANIPFNEHLCQHCGYRGKLEEKIKCSGCANPERATIFDVNVKIRRIGQGDSSNVEINEWSTPGPLPEEYTAKSCEPLDLSWMLYQDPEKQAKMMNITNPLHNSMQEKRTVKY